MLLSCPSAPRGAATPHAAPGVRRCAVAAGFGVLVLSAVLGGGWGCASTGPPVSAVPGTARRTYYEGMTELVAGNYIRARKLLSRVSRSPRAGRYAPLARLRTADALFLQQRFQEAIEVYRSFVAQYQADPNLPYARYRIAAAYFERMPTSWFLAPPAYELDQTMTTEAERELKGFLKAFPVSRYAADARELLRKVWKMLAARELYVADYYAARGAHRAEAWRLQAAVDRYPVVAAREPVVWRMARAYRAAGETADEARACALYLERFPEGPHLAGAKARLAAIRAAAGPSQGPGGPTPSPPTSE